MQGKSIYSIALENGVSKYKIRSVILNDLKWTMERFERYGKQIIINSEDEEKIVNLLQPILVKKNIPISDLEPICEKLESMKDDIDNILDRIRGIVKP